MNKTRAIEIVDRFTNLYETFYMNNVLKEENQLYCSDVMASYECHLSDLKAFKAEIINNIIDNS